MIIARAPVRISFAGGGTDLPVYYERYGGMVVSASLTRHAYVMVEPTGRPTIQIASADYGTFFTTANADATLDAPGELALPRAALSYCGIDSGVDLFVATEVPPGTGLGSSSAVTAALVRALAALQGREPEPAEIAEAACAIELERLGMPIGKQDQYAAAFGGLNAITFTARRVTVEPLHLAIATLHRLEECLMLFFTGTARTSANILAEQRRAVQASEGDVLSSLEHIKALAVEARRLLESGAPDALGELLHESWLHKRRLASGIATTTLDNLYAAAREAGATGGKITGAGGGGFLLLYCPPERQASVSAALSTRGLRRMDVRFSHRGAHVVMADGSESRDTMSAEVPAYGEIASETARLDR